MPTSEEIEEMRTHWRQQAYASNNGDFISIKTYSGYSRAFIDLEARESVLSPQASDVELGEAVLLTLKQSRFLSYDAETSLIQSAKEDYDQWAQKLMNQYGYKTKRVLFRKMKSCGFDCKDNIITIRPSHHYRLDGWNGEGFTEDDYIKIPADSPPEEIGAALRLAFSRCTGMGADEA